MEDLKVLQSAIDKAVQKGAFSLQEVGVIARSLGSVANVLQQVERAANPVEVPEATIKK